MLSLPTQALPEELAAVAERNWRRIHEAAAEAHEDLGPALDACVEEQDGCGAPRGPALAQVLACSEFIADSAAARPRWLLDLLRTGEYERALDAGGVARSLDDALAAVTEPDALEVALRELRNRLLAAVTWRDITGLATLSETMESMSLLADMILQRALALLHRWEVAAQGAPIGEESGAEQEMVVIALGKLGAGELNLSSDVDLVFAFAEDGITADGGKTNQQFFTALGQRLIRTLDARTAQGIVFRVDMRLRPFGDSGPLVASFNAMERYFEEHGRDWERYAWIRARVCAGDHEAGERLIRSLEPFVFRRYLDFGAIASLREMKRRIESERSAARMADDIKLGPGGIRDVEFIAQMLQLIWAGRHARLRRRGLEETYRALVALDLISAQRAEQLCEAYELLRNLEHKLQAIRDQQTQKLPRNELDRLRVAFMMGHGDEPASLDSRISALRRRVAGEFADLISGDGQAPNEDRWRGLWHEMADDVLEESLAEAGFDEAAGVAEALRRLRVARDRPWVGNEGRTRLDRLMPLFLEKAQSAPRPGLAVRRVVPLFEAIIRRSAYFMLLLENPQALEELVHICATSHWLSDELARHPALLDELLDPELLYTVADKETLREALAQQLRWTDEDDFEAQLEVLRQFKESHSFRVAACELKGILPLMNVSDYHTFLAEVILEAALAIAWRSTRGAPAPTPMPRHFIVVGYGKLGGVELGPDSDLDLVFIHRLGDEHMRFLHRMVRRLLQVLTTRTHSGSLYEVDMRLRPSGHAGTLISSLEAFRKYQQEAAWTWEHQALVRSRVVAGDLELGEAFAAVRRTVLSRPRDREALKEQVLSMRRRIEDSAARESDLKRRVGGIVDIEFMVQYLVLGWTQDHPELCRFTDNIRILETAARLRLISEEQARTLKDAYLALRAERHRAALDIADDERARGVLASHREQIRECWNALLG